MGLIKALGGAVGSALGDQWKEYFYCEALDQNTLMTKGIKKTSGRSSNTKGSDNVISTGSVISVADGQAMLIVEQGKVVEYCDVPGEFTYDASTEPTIMAGLNGANIKGVFATIGKRFTFGGETPKDQRVYYINTKELPGNKYGTVSPIPIHLVDTNARIDMDIDIRCNGEYSFKITNPILFYTNVAGNVSGDYMRSNLESQMKTELLTGLQPALGKFSEAGVRYTAFAAHTMEIADELNEVLSSKWRDLRGIEVVAFGISSIRPTDEDAERIKTLQQDATLMDPSRAAAHLVSGQVSAMNKAASNEAGAMTGFMGMGMAGQMGGMNAANLFAMGAQQQAAAPQATAAADTWKCACGTVVSGNFCPECGARKPASEGWKCTCGTVNKGKFCTECGAKKPAAAVQWKCDKCGWEPEKGANPPKFCPECGDPFDNNDIVG